jgi:hypothetical protein
LLRVLDAIDENELSLRCFSKGPLEVLINTEEVAVLVRMQLTAQQVAGPVGREFTHGGTGKYVRKGFAECWCIGQSTGCTPA